MPQSRPHASSQPSTALAKEIGWSASPYYEPLILEARRPFYDFGTLAATGNAVDGGGKAGLPWASAPIAADRRIDSAE